MPTQTVYFITGAARGIGLGLVKLYLARPHHVVICAVRDVSAASSQALLALPRAQGSQALLVKVNGETAARDAPAAVHELQSAHGIAHIDAVIPVAGISGELLPVHALASDALVHSFLVNTCAPLEVYKATRALLLRAPRPRFVPVSAASASLSQGKAAPVPIGGYSATKAALNALAKYIHFEEDSLIAFPIHPGVVKTDMSQETIGHIPNAEEKLGEIGHSMITIDEAAAGMAKVIDEATRDKTGGVFMSYTGEVIPW